MATTEAGISAKAVETGAILYRDTCAGCHGVAGRGIPGLAPALNSPDFFARRLDEISYAGSLRSYIEGTIAAGRPVSQHRYALIMPAWSRAYGGSLRDDEIRDIASFILNWQAADPGAASAYTPAAGASASSVERGKAVFYGPAGCLGCHGAPGSDGVSGPDMAGIARRAAEQSSGLTAEQAIRQSILAPGAAIASGCQTDTCPDIMPRDYSSRLRQVDLDALIAYLLTLDEGGPTVSPQMVSPTDAAEDAAPATTTPIPTLRAPSGDSTQGRVLYEQECAPCHGDRGQGQAASSLAAVYASIDPFNHVRAVMEQGVPGTTMPAWGKNAGGRLSDEQLNDIAAYVAGWAKERQSSSGAADASPTSRSTTLYAVLLLLILVVGGPAVLFLAQRRAETTNKSDRR